jgi:hypothetical protein
MPSSAVISQKNLDLFVSYAEALAEYEQILKSTQTRYNIVISVASQQLQEYIQGLLQRLSERVTFLTLTEWLDSKKEERTLIITTNQSLLELHLEDHQSASGIFLIRNAEACMSVLLSSLISSKRVMLLRRPLKHRQLIQAVQMLTTKVHPISIAEQPKCDRLGVTHPLKILVVDDNQFNQMVSKSFLMSHLDYGKDAKEIGLRGSGLGGQWPGGSGQGGSHKLRHNLYGHGNARDERL